MSGEIRHRHADGGDRPDPVRVSPPRDPWQNCHVGDVRGAHGTDGHEPAAADGRRRGPAPGRPRRRAGRPCGPARSAGRARRPGYDLRARGRGPKDAPTLLLLHGYVASVGLNWFRAFDALGAALPGGGARCRGSRPRPAVPSSHAPRRLRRRPGRAHRHARHRTGDRGRLLDGRADRAAALEASPREGRRPRVVRNGTRARLRRAALERRVPGERRGLARAAGQLAAVPSAGANALRRVRAHRPASFLEWAADEMRRHDVRMLTEAARSISRFDSRPWIQDIDVPTAVLRTNRDRLVDPASQTELGARSAARRSSSTTTVTSRVRRRRSPNHSGRLPRRGVAGQRVPSPLCCRVAVPGSLRGGLRARLTCTGRTSAPLRR